LQTCTALLPSAQSQITCAPGMQTAALVPAEPLDPPVFFVVSPGSLDPQASAPNIAPTINQRRICLCTATESKRGGPASTMPAST
jgi:hypothetical protein